MTRLIGHRCKHSDMLSRVILIGRGLKICKFIKCGLSKKEHEKILSSFQGIISLK